MTADEAARARASHNRMVGWSKVDPAERSRRMRELRAIRTAKERAEREARGEKPKPKRGGTAPLPSADALRDRMDEILREREEQGLPPLTVEQLIREASLRERITIARATAAALRNDRDRKGGAQ